MHPGQCASGKPAKRSIQCAVAVNGRGWSCMVHLREATRQTLKKGFRFVQTIVRIHFIVNYYELVATLLTVPAAQVSSVTAPENVKNAAAVDTRMMRAMRPLSAPNRSASNDTLLALGSAATSTITVSVAPLRPRPS